MQIVNIFQYHLSKLVVVYLDDILIYSKGWDKHLEHVHLVLDILQQHMLQAKIRKSFFEQTFVQYLGLSLPKQDFK
jgi:hypothetical protein